MVPPQLCPAFSLGYISAFASLFLHSFYFSLLFSHPLNFLETNKEDIISCFPDSQTRKGTGRGVSGPPIPSSLQFFSSFWKCCPWKWLKAFEEHSGPKKKKKDKYKPQALFDLKIFRLKYSYNIELHLVSKYQSQIFFNALAHIIFMTIL